jgi:hypothetical protein
VTIALPVVPAGSLAGTPVATINEVARESVGMHGLAQQVAAVLDGLPPADHAQAVLLAGNYGETGALDRWAGELHLPKIYSGHKRAVVVGTAARGDPRRGGGQLPAALPHRPLRAVFPGRRPARPAGRGGRESDHRLP